MLQFVTVDPFLRLVAVENCQNISFLGATAGIRAILNLGDTTFREGP